MKITLVTGNVTELKTECLVVGIYKGGELTESAEAVDKASEGAVRTWIKSGDISDALGKTALFPMFPGVAAKRVVFVGLGDKDGSCEDFAAAVNAAVKASVNAKTVTLTAGEWLAEKDSEWGVQTVAQVSSRAFDTPKNFKSGEKKAEKTPACVQIVVEKKTKVLTEAVSKGCAAAEGAKIAKDLCDMPANLCNPKYMAETAVKLGKEKGFEVTVLDEKTLKKLKMGALLGVAAGSSVAPCVVVMEYKGGKKGDKPVALVGKGLTFDAGGISLKPSAGMDEMKYDMSGAAAMIGTMAAAAELKLPLNITAVIGCTENMPGGSACKPGDILTAMSGKTVEVLNTDAEGRLVLCDLITYTITTFKPACVIDAATLTGACVVALGSDLTGLFSNHEPLAAELMQAADTGLDPVWRMPLGKRFTKKLESRFADLANIGGRDGGACTAAAFLQEFAGDTPWAHLDIAGTAWKSGADKGATGRPVSLLVNFLIDQAA